MDAFDYKHELKKLTILFVEDEEILRTAMSKTLTRLFKEVIIGVNGEDGLKKYQNHAIDIVLTDINMPVMNGLDMAKEIRAKNEKIPIIVASAYSDTEYFVKAIEIGIDKYLIKPIELKMLKSTLADIAQNIFNKQISIQKSHELDTEKALTTLILDSQSSIVMLVNESFELIRTNNMFFDTFNFESIEEFNENKGFQKIIDISSDASLHDIILLNNELLDLKVTIKDRFYKERVFDFTIDELRAEEFNYVLITLHDITPLEDALKKAKYANESKSVFLANMSHEIRTPMNGVLGFTDLLEQTELSHKQNDYVGVIKKSAHSLLGIINDILDFSKIESGKLEIEESLFDFRQELESVAELFITIIEEKNITFNFYLSPLLPDKLYGDALRLRQVLINLLGNAFKFTSIGGEVSLIVEHVKTNQSTQTIHFSVEDTGIGIANEQQKNIFKPFSQADATTTKKFGGTGLGLAISNKLIAMMNGTLELKSQLGKGSCFYFTLEMKSESSIPVSSTPLNTEIYLFKPSHASSTFEIITRYLNAFNFSFTSFTKANELPKRSASVIFPTHHLVQEFKETLQKPFFNVIVVLKSRSLQTLQLPFEHKSIYAPLNGSKLFNALLDESEVKAKKEEVENNSLKQLSFKALVAEDNKINQQLIEILLSELGADVHITENGEECFQAYTKATYDIIFMDINMPILDGVRASEKILAYEEVQEITHTPIIALTANALKGDKEKYLSKGLDDYLSKPIQKDALDSIIQHYIQTQRTVVEEKIFNLELIKQELGLNDKIIKMLLQTFLETIDSDIEDLKNALSKKNLVEVASAAHKIKGSCANLRFVKVASVAKTIESNAKEQNSIAYDDEFNNLTALITTLKSDINTFLN